MMHRPYIAVVTTLFAVAVIEANSFCAQSYAELPRCATSISQIVHDNDAVDTRTLLGDCLLGARKIVLKALPSHKALAALPYVVDAELRAGTDCFSRNCEPRRRLLWLNALHDNNDVWAGGGSATNRTPNVGLDLFAKADYPAAFAWYRDLYKSNATAEDPALVDGGYYAAIIEALSRAARGDYVQAIVALRRPLSMSPHATDALFVAGAIALAAGKRQAAEQYLTQSIQASGLGTGVPPRGDASWGAQSAYLWLST
jgi:tetratricopeptide (TPR) repeat protein